MTSDKDDEEPCCPRNPWCLGCTVCDPIVDAFLNNTRQPQTDALKMAREALEAFKQEVSDEVQEWVDHYRQEGWEGFDRFFIFTNILHSITYYETVVEYAEDLRAALNACGLEIRIKNDD